jgi:hypothetical protein
MDCSDEPLILEVVPRMAMEGGSDGVGRVESKEFASQIVSVSAVEDLATVKILQKQATQKKTSKAPVKTAGVFDEIQTEKMDKAPVEAGKAVASIGKIQTENMDKALDALDGEKNQVSTMTREAPVEAVAIDKYKLPADYVSSILAIPREALLQDMLCLQADKVAKLMGVTDESPEEERQLYKEEAARMQRINNEFVLFQDEFREQFDRQGYVVVDEEYLTNAVKLQEYSNELWKDQDWTGVEFADPNDPDYASWYEHCKREPAEGLCSV